jgi:hypothetical protein
MDSILKHNKKFWEEIIAYFPLMQHRPHTKQKIRGGIKMCRQQSGVKASFYLFKIKKVGQKAMIWV